MVNFLDVKVAVGVQGVEEHAGEQGVGDLPGHRVSQPFEEPEELPLTGEFHQHQHDARGGIAWVGGRIEAGQVKQGVTERGQEGEQVGGQVVGQVKKVGEGGGNSPPVRSLVHDHGKDGRQRQAVALLMAGEDLQDVAKQAQRHRRIDGALVFEQEVEQRLSAAKAGGEEEVGVGLLERGFDEGTGGHGEGGPVDVTDDGVRQVAFEERGGILWLGKDRLEEGVVWLGREVQVGWELVHGAGVAGDAAVDKPAAGADQRLNRSSYCR